MPLSRRAFLIASAAAAALGPRSVRAAPGGHPDFLVVVLANGGWDPTFALDPKPDHPEVDGPEVDHPNTEGVRTFHDGQTIAVNPEVRPAVGRFFEAWGDRSCVVRGMWTGSIVHEPCRVRLLTGTTRPTRPDWATIFGRERGQEEPIGAVDFSGLSYPGELASSTARIGARSQLKALVDPDAAFGAPSWADYTLPLFRMEPEERTRVAELLAERVARFRAERPGGAVVDDLAEAMARADRLRADGAALTGGLSLSREPGFTEQIDLAVDLLDRGLCRAITLKSASDFDTHSANHQQHGYIDGFFAGLHRLMEGLAARGLAERTTVVALSEMGRTPRLNAAAGKDHWAHTSQLLIGAGVRGGIALGGTDERLESQKIDLDTGEVLGSGQDEAAPGERLGYDHFAAGILAHLGVDPAPWYPEVRPFTAWSEVV